MGNLLDTSKLFIKRNSATILTCMGGVGVVATSVMAVKATPKAMLLLESAEKEKGEKLTKLEVVRVAGPSYIPAVVIGVSTIACVFGANVLNKRNQAALMSAYALLDSSYKEYKAKIKELYGEEANTQVITSIAKDKYDEKIEVEGDNRLFFDYYSGRYFESTLERVQAAEYELNRKLVLQDYAYLNDWYDELGIEMLDSGFMLGWTMAACADRYWQSWVDFRHETATMDDGLECIIIHFQQEPIMDFENYI